MNKKSLTGIKYVVLSVALIQMGASAMSVILADIAGAFPEATSQQVQFIMTIPGIFAMVMSLISGKIAQHIPSKALIMAGMYLCIVCGIGGLLKHNTIEILYVWSIVFGIGVGIATTLVTISVSTYFTGDEKATLFGLQSSATSLGGMMMNFFGGIISKGEWNHVYFVFLLAIPGFLFTMFCYPGEKNANLNVESSTKMSPANQGVFYGVDRKVILYSLIGGIFFMLFNAGPANFSMLMAERSGANSAVAGMFSSFLLLGGAIMGLIFGKIRTKTGAYTMTIGMMILSAGFLMICKIQYLPVNLFGAFVAGASLTMVAPQVNYIVTEGKSPSELAMVVGISTASANLGSFMTPVLTGIIYNVTGNEQADFRMAFCAGLIVLLALLVIPLERKRISQKVLLEAKC